MAAFDTSDYLRLGAFFAVWAVLCLGAGIGTARLRRKQLQHAKPLDAPVDLDAYDIAYLAGGIARLREAALVKMIAAGTLCLGDDGKHISLHGVPPADGHPVESAVHAALVSRPRHWPSACYNALGQLRGGFDDCLRRQDLLASRMRFSWWWPPMLLWLSSLALSILAVIFLPGPHAPPGNTDPTGRTQTLIIVPALCCAASFAGFVSAQTTCYRNRRGEHVLAQLARAFAHLDEPKMRYREVERTLYEALPAKGGGSSQEPPAEESRAVTVFHWLPTSNLAGQRIISTHGPDVIPAELALAAAIFGLRALCGRPACAALWTALYPPQPSSGNG